MSSTTDALYPVLGDMLDRAISSLAAKARYHTEAAQILRAIKARSGCVGRMFNRSVLPAIQAVMPGYRVSYGIRDYVKRRPRNLYIVRLNASGNPVYGPYNHWEFELATYAAPKLSMSVIDDQIAYHVKEAESYTDMAACLPSQVAAYNAAAAYLQPIKRSLDTALLYAGI